MHVESQSGEPYTCSDSEMTLLIHEAENETLLNQIVSGLDVMYDTYSKVGLRSIALLGVNLEASEFLHKCPVGGFIYKENDKLFLCINRQLSLADYNFVKLYLFAVYLLSKNELKDGIFPEVFMYPVMGRTNNSDLYYKLCIRLVQELIMGKMLSDRRFSEPVAKLTIVRPFIPDIKNGMENLTAEDREWLDKTALYSTYLNLPEGIVYTALIKMAMDDGLVTFGQVKDSALYSQLYTSAPEAPFECSVRSEIFKELNKNVHSVFFGTFESTAVVLDAFSKVDETKKQEKLTEEFDSEVKPDTRGIDPLGQVENKASDNVEALMTTPVREYDCSHKNVEVLIDTIKTSIAKAYIATADLAEILKRLKFSGGVEQTVESMLTSIHGGQDYTALLTDLCDIVEKNKGTSVMAESASQLFKTSEYAKLDKELHIGEKIIELMKGEWYANSDQSD